MSVQTAVKTGLTGIWIHGKSVRVDFMHRGTRHRHTLSLEPTELNLHHAACLRTAALYALKTGNYNAADLFPDSYPTNISRQQSKRLCDLLDDYIPLTAANITKETQSRYEVALNACLNIVGRNRQINELMPADIQQLRVDLIATRTVSTVNHYLAAFTGFLRWCEDNKYCEGLTKHCTRFTKGNKEPDPFTHAEYRDLCDKGCQHPLDKASLMLAFYSGLRPGELCALALEDVAPDLSRLTVRRSITRSGTFKVPKNGKERTMLLFPPAQEALEVLITNAKARNPVDLHVWLNRNESRIDHVRPFLSPHSHTRKSTASRLYILSAWGVEWRNILRRAEVRPRPPYQARHTYACWNLAAGGNLAFIAAQMGHADCLTFMKTYGRWIHSESSSEQQRIWEAQQNLGRFGTNFCPKRSKQKS
ncbi:MAG: tyrosine-type recombinase/integrase [Burkholderiaceae bacterium]